MSTVSNGKTQRPDSCFTQSIALHPITSHPCYENLAAWAAHSGAAPAEKLESLGIACGKTVDIRMLDQVSRDYGVAVYLFFEEASGPGADARICPGRVRHDP